MEVIERAGRDYLSEKSLAFAEQVIDLYRFLIDKKEFVLSKQFLRSGTSIGANIYEAKYAISRADFISKMHIALKEASETEYWLILLEKAEISERIRSVSSTQEFMSGT
ncbi:four helix bundle protein [Anaerolentibacter hominis]|uniref:four helix bundle protein n=1 Tax=Anaerolentibacter hominis TaxID=3079009 RepID=UPI0031B826E4